MAARTQEDKIRAKIARLRKSPSYAETLDLVRTIDNLVRNSAASSGIALDEGRLSVVRDKALQDAFEICFREYAENPRDAAQELCAYVSGIGSKRQVRPRLGASLSALCSSQRDFPVSDTARYRECSAMYHLAVSSLLLERESSTEGRQLLRALMSNLAVSYDDLGRMFKVSGETVRRWETGATTISNERKAEITLAGATLERLLKIFRTARLPEVIRRPAELFSGQTALDSIFQGKIAEVADRYETALRYQA